MQDFNDLSKALYGEISKAQQALDRANDLLKEIVKLDRAYSGSKDELSVGAVVKLGGDWQAYMLAHNDNYRLNHLTVRTFGECVYQITGFMERDGVRFAQMSALAGHNGGGGYMPIPVEFVEIIRA